MLAQKLDDLSMQARAQLAQLPLWTGKVRRRRSPASADASNDGARGPCGPGRTTPSSNARSTSSTDLVSDANCAAGAVRAAPSSRTCNGAAASANSPSSRRRCTPAGRDTTCVGRRPTRASRASHSARARGLRCTVHERQELPAEPLAVGRLEGVDLLASCEGTLGSVQPAARPTRGIARVSAPRHRTGMRLSRRVPRSRRGRPACRDAWAAFDACSPHWRRLGPLVLDSFVPGSNPILKGRQYG